MSNCLESAMQYEMTNHHILCEAEQNDIASANHNVYPEFACFE